MESLVLLLLAAVPSGELEDEVLARRIREGDREAFRAFFDRYHGLLYGYLRRRNVPGVVCEDLIQNAFVVIWERRDRIDPGKSLRAFLFKIAYNRALNHFRDTARFAGDVEPADLDAPAPAAGPDHTTDTTLVYERLLEAVQALPEKRRAVFELCFLEDLTYREAAEVLGITRKTVENQMARALKTLREALDSYNDF